MNSREFLWADAQEFLYDQHVDVLGGETAFCGARGEKGFDYFLWNLIKSMIFIGLFRSLKISEHLHIHNDVMVLVWPL